MFLKLLFIFLTLVYASAVDSKFETNSTNYNVNTIGKCERNATFFQENNITFVYGLLVDCRAFIFDSSNNDTWEDLSDIMTGAETDNNRCFGNDFTVELQVQAKTRKLMLFILDKDNVIFHRIPLETDILPFFSQPIPMEYLKDGPKWKKRGSSEIYQKYAYAGAVTGNVVSLVSTSVAGFHITVGIRKEKNMDYRCILSPQVKDYYPPLYLDVIPSTDWRYPLLLEQYPEVNGEKKTSREEYYLGLISWLWILCIAITILTVIMSIITGVILNRVREAKMKLGVAVEALIASSCTNPEHQLKRSALLTRCGFPSVELNDANVVTGVSLQDETGLQNVNEYDVLAEQIRCVQAAPLPEKSNKSVSQSVTKSSKQ